MKNKTITLYRFLAIGLFSMSSLFSLAQTNVFDNIIATSSEHTLLKAALEQEGLDVALRDNAATYTVFAPNNAAFTDLATALNTDITGLLNLPNLRNVLLYHVLGSTVTAAQISNGAVVSALETSNTLKLTKTTSGKVYVNQAEVISADLSADNGVVHVSNAVLLPSVTVADVAINNGFTSLVAAVVKAELLPALSNPFASYTVFAPTNEAFDSLANALNTDINGLLALPNLADVLLYHVLGSRALAADISNGALVSPLSTTNTLKLTKTSAGAVFVNQARVTSTDIAADNGVVHVLNEVVLPANTVADVAIDNGFNTLVAAVIKAELLPALSDPFAQFTVFAPNDSAFVRLAEALNTTPEALLELPNLSDILLYHVVAGTVRSTDLTEGPVTALNQGQLNIGLSGGVKVNQASVLLADVPADNGVVHVIDAVLIQETNNVQSFSLNAAVLYPNPAGDFVYVNGVETGAYRILNASGQLIQQGNVEGAIATDTLPAGLYFLQVENENGAWYARLMKN